jgi:hypothetical protein
MTKDQFNAIVVKIAYEFYKSGIESAKFNESHNNIAIHLRDSLEEWFDVTISLNGDESWEKVRKQNNIPEYNF